MEREIINSSDFLHIVAVKKDGKIKRYEITPLEAEGFRRVSEGRVETGKVYFPGAWDLEKIVSDIERVATE